MEADHAKATESGILNQYMPNTDFRSRDDKPLDRIEFFEYASWPRAAVVQLLSHAGLAGIAECK